jgi:hypothetical protein
VLASVPSSTPPAARYTRASELNTHAYCRRAWWLEQVRGEAPANAEALARGEAAHAAHGRTLRSAARLRRWALLSLGLGLLLLALALRAP